jgi:hypothetical protein
LCSILQNCGDWSDFLKFVECVVWATILFLLVFGSCGIM